MMPSASEDGLSARRDGRLPAVAATGEPVWHHIPLVFYNVP